MESPVNDRGSGHESWEDRTANVATNGIPGHRIKPVPKIHEAIMSQVASSSVVEPGIELVDHTFISNDWEDANDESEDSNEA